MTNLNFTVTAVWDPEAEVFYSESDITGLHIEAATIDEFMAAARELGPQLVVDNHLSKQDVLRRPLLDLIPSIFLSSRPQAKVA